MPAVKIPKRRKIFETLTKIKSISESAGCDLNFSRTLRTTELSDSFAVQCSKNRRKNPFSERDLRRQVAQALDQVLCRSGRRWRKDTDHEDHDETDRNPQMPAAVDWMSSHGSMPMPCRPSQSMLSNWTRSM